MPVALGRDDPAPTAYIGLRRVGRDELAPTVRRAR